MTEPVVRLDAAGRTAALAVTVPRDAGSRMDEQELEERLRRNQLWEQELLSGAFGTAEADVEALLATAQAELGPHRQERCVTVVAAGQLSARPRRLGAIAELVVATGTIGVRWWSERLVRWTPSPAPFDHTPDEILDGAATPREWVEPSGGVLQWLANEAAEAVAVLEWGPPAGWADLNDPNQQLPAPGRDGARRPLYPASRRSLRRRRAAALGPRTGSERQSSRGDLADSG